MGNLRLENWGEVVVATLCLPALLASVVLSGAYVRAGSDTPYMPWTTVGFVWLVTASPLLWAVGGIMVCTGAALSPWLPGRRRVKYSWLVAATVLWAWGWALLGAPGLIDLP